MLEDIEALGVGGHQSVLDPVVNHLDEVPRAVRAAVKVALLGGSAGLLSPGGAWPGPHAGGQCGEDRVETTHHVDFTPDHHAVAALESPHAAACPHVDVMDSSGLQGRGPLDVVVIVRVAAVDQDVSRLEPAGKLLDHLFDDRRRHHQPHGTRRLQLADEFLQAAGTLRPLPDQGGGRLGMHVVNDAFLPVALQTPNHVGAHPTQTDHAELHGCPISKHEDMNGNGQADQRQGPATINES